MTSVDYSACILFGLGQKIFKNLKIDRGYAGSIFNPKGYNLSKILKRLRTAVVDETIEVECEESDNYIYNGCSETENSENIVVETKDLLNNLEEKISRVALKMLRDFYVFRLKLTNNIRQNSKPKIKITDYLGKNVI